MNKKVWNTYFPIFHLNAKTESALLTCNQLMAVLPNIDSIETSESKIFQMVSVSDVLNPNRSRIPFINIGMFIPEPTTTVFGIMPWSTPYVKNNL